MNLHNKIVFLPLLLSSLLPLPSFAYSTVDQMNNQGTSTKVIRVYTGQWRGWTHHDQFINKSTNSTNKKISSSSKKQSVYQTSSELVRNAARKLEIGQLNTKKSMIKKPRVLMVTNAKWLKAKNVAVITNTSKQITKDSIKRFARIFNINPIEKKAYKTYKSRKLVVYKPIKTKNTNKKSLKFVPVVNKGTALRKTTQSNSKQKTVLKREINNEVIKPTNWSTVSQSLPLLIKALSE